MNVDMMNRRSFLRGMLVVTAVAIVPTAALKAMEAIKPLPILYGDGIGDDTAALQALFDGKAFRTLDGFVGIAEECRLADAHLSVSSMLSIGQKRGMLISDCVFEAVQDFKGPTMFAFVGVQDAEATIANCMFVYQGEHGEEFHGHTRSGHPEGAEVW